MLDASWSVEDYPTPAHGRRLTRKARRARCLSVQGGPTVKRRLALLILSLVVLAVGVLPSPADALCTQVGQVVSVFVQPGASLTSVFLRNSNQASAFVWFTATNDSKMVAAALVALNGQTKVAMSGNAAVCPAVGASRFMGTATVLSLAP